MNDDLVNNQIKKILLLVFILKTSIQSINRKSNGKPVLSSYYNGWLVSVCFIFEEAEKSSGNNLLRKLPLESVKVVCFVCMWCPSR